MSERLEYFPFSEGLRVASQLCEFYNCHECPIFDEEKHKCPMENFAYLSIDEQFRLTGILYNWANKHHISYRKRYFQEYEDYLNERKMCVLDLFPEVKRPDYCDHKEHPDRCVDCWREKCFVKTTYSLKSNDTVKP